MSLWLRDLAVGPQVQRTLKHALWRSHAVLLGSLLLGASRSTAHIASEFQKSASKEHPLN
jgi:hypothetical protein